MPKKEPDLKPSRKTNTNAANIGFEEKLWLAADKMRNNMDPAEYKHTVPGQLFYSTGIPVSLWFVNRNKENPRFRSRKGETLFIDARKMGALIDRVHRELSDEDIKRIAGAYHAWRASTPLNQRNGTEQLVSAPLNQRNGTEQLVSAPLNDHGAEGCSSDYTDVPGFCRSVKIEEIREHEYILTPGRYVGIEEKADDGEPFEEKMQRLTEELEEQFVKSEHLDKRIRENLKGIGFEV